jgi:hypothetical protein
LGNIQRDRHAGFTRFDHRQHNRRCPMARANSKSSNSAIVTRDHDEIVRWVEERGGRPATVKGTARSGAGVLRIDFPGQGEDAKMQHLSWDEFFEKFDEENLSFLHQDVTADGDVSRFSKFVDAAEAQRAGRRKGSDSRGSSKAASRQGQRRARSSRGRSEESGRSSRPSASRPSSRPGSASYRGSRTSTRKAASSRGSAKSAARPRASNSRSRR